MLRQLPSPQGVALLLLGSLVAAAAIG